MNEPAVALLKALRKARLPAHAAVWAGVAVDGSAARVDGPWVLADLMDDGIVVGASARREFRSYAVVDSVDAACRLAISLIRNPAPVEALRYDHAEAQSRGILTAQRIHTRTAGRDGVAGPAELQVGDLLDALEPETALHLYPLATPFPQRSMPPLFAAGPCRAYEVRRPFADVDGPREGSVAPWFEQPGGGAQVVLDRPIRWYVDQGFLMELVSR